MTDGERVASTTLIDALLDKDFQLVINDAVYNVCSPEKGTTRFLFFSSVRLISLSLPHPLFTLSSPAVCTSHEHAMELEDMKHVVHLLHTALHLPEHHLLKERELLERLDNLKQQLSPLEKVVEVSQCLHVTKLTAC